MHEQELMGSMMTGGVVKGKLVKVTVDGILVVVVIVVLVEVVELVGHLPSLTPSLSLRHCHCH